MAVFKRPGSAIWQCEFMFKGQRVRESTGCTNKVQAQAWEVRRRAEVKEDHELAQDGVKRLTLHEVAQRWLKLSADHYTDHKNNAGRVRKLFGDGAKFEQGRWVMAENVRPGLPKDLRVHELTQEHLANLKALRLTEERNSPATINRELSLVQTLLGFAATIGVLMPKRPIVFHAGRNKAASLKMKERQGKLRWLTGDEERKLLDCLAGKADRLATDQNKTDAYHLTMFLMDTGARYNEVAAVPWSAIDLEAGTVNLYRSKVGNESMLTLPGRSAAMLRDRWKAMEGAGYRWVFPALKGRRWAGLDKHRGHATGSIQTAIDECGLNEDINLDRVTPHTFRDTFASRLAQAGLSLLKISQLLGHSTVVMTQKYAHLCPDSAGAEAAAILNRMHGASAAGPVAEQAQEVPRVSGWTPRLVA